MDSGTYEWMARIEAKLDYLISRVAPPVKKEKEKEKEAGA